MIDLRIAPIVEGHGEDRSVRTLLQRVWTELLGGMHVEVIKPIRRPRSKLIKPGEIEKAVGLARLKLAVQVVPAVGTLVLILLDAEGDPACILGPELQERARAGQTDLDVSCVLAVVEYETWFVGAAESLGDFLVISSPDTIPGDPECTRSAKAWIQKRFRGPKYSETLDQPRMTARMDLSLCRNRSPSFDKLCRELERRLPGRV